MRAFVPNQSQQQERRTALTPMAVKKLASMGLQVLVEAGLGRGAGHDDEQYRDAGATVVSDGTAWSEADVVLTVQPPTAQQAQRMKAGALLVGSLAPLKQPELVRAAVQARLTAFAMEFVPRISRAQSMDVLSSQANLAGYKAVLLAANHCPKVFPMLMTAAGTIAPAKVLVIGAGVAGLQAIATAKRLGAIVEAYDVRAVVKEQILSLGARFVELPTASSDAQTKDGYAREQTEAERREQAELMAKHVIAADAVICTAAVFGKPPPMLIPRSVVEQMSPGSVLVDLAADAGASRGNCEATRPGEVHTTDRGVVIDGTLNLPSLVPVHASQVYAGNMIAFLAELFPAPPGGSAQPRTLTLNFEDEVLKAAAITHDGKIVNDMVAKVVN